MSELPKRRRGIQSVGIGVRVLSALADARGPAALSAVAQASGLSASQAHRYLASLIAAGMARQEGKSGLYDLDHGAIRIGLAALARLDVFGGAEVTFQAYVRETGRTCLVAVWGDAGPTVVRWFAGSPPVVTSLAIGSVLPLLRSATGQVFLAFGAWEAMDAHARRDIEAEANSGSGGKAAGLPDLDARLDALRRRVRAAGMVATVEDEVFPGLRATAAPVFDLQGRLVLVATSIANGAFPRDGDTDAIAALRQACRTLTRTFGGTWPAERL